jgi:outer membrane protein OmpA-like peptidoglycan-associated protein
MWLKDLMRVFLLGGIGALAGCAHAVPPELASARQAYHRASAGPAAQLAPVELHKAEVMLSTAERAFSDTPDAPSTRDLAYVAERQAEIAEAVGDTQRNSQARARSDRDYQSKQAQLVQQTRGELVRTRQQLASAERDQQQSMVQLGAERQARADAEKKASEAEQNARDALAKLAAVRQEERGMVITLSGSVLFASDQSTLLPEAQTRLNQVTEALMTTKERNVIVEGYTDSRGSEGHNLDLSQRRAEAVRAYLVSRGYPTANIQARGLGKANPVADNASAEGRANNRRVEIIVQPASGQASPLSR